MGVSSHPFNLGLTIMIKYISFLSFLFLISCQHAPQYNSEVQLNEDRSWERAPIPSLTLSYDKPLIVGVYSEIKCSNHLYSNRVTTVSEKVCNLLKSKQNFTLVNVNDIRDSSECDIVIKIDANYQITNQHTVDAPVKGRLYDGAFNWEVILIDPKKGNILKKWHITPYTLQFREPYWDDIAKKEKEQVSEEAEHHLLSKIALSFNKYSTWEQTIAKTHSKKLQIATVVDKNTKIEVVNKNYDKKSTALIVGISEYAFYSKISSATNDANLMAEMMRNNLNIAPENIVLLKDGAKGMNSPTKVILEERLKLLCKETSSEGNLWVYLSGHGEIENGELMFIPQDGKTDHKIPIKWIVAQMNTSKAAQKNLILDICHADIEAKGFVVKKKIPKIDNQKTALFMSCNTGELSYPLADGSCSVYTKCFIDAVKTQDNPKINIDTLQEKINEGVRSWRLKHGKIQTPQLIKPKN